MKVVSVVPRAAAVPAVEAKPEVPGSVTIELSREAAIWLEVFAGKHNGGPECNPTHGLYEVLGKANSAMYGPDHRRLEADRQDATARLNNCFTVERHSGDTRVLFDVYRVR